MDPVRTKTSPRLVSRAQPGELMTLLRQALCWIGTRGLCNGHQTTTTVHLRFTSAPSCSLCKVLLSFTRQFPQSTGRAAFAKSVSITCRVLLAGQIPIHRLSIITPVYAKLTYSPRSRSGTGPAPEEGPQAPGALKAQQSTSAASTIELLTYKQIRCK